MLAFWHGLNLYIYISAHTAYIYIYIIILLLLLIIIIYLFIYLFIHTYRSYTQIDNKQLCTVVLIGYSCHADIAPKGLRPIKFSLVDIGIVMSSKTTSPTCTQPDQPA